MTALLAGTWSAGCSGPGVGGRGSLTVGQPYCSTSPAPDRPRAGGPRGSLGAEEGHAHDPGAPVGADTRDDPADADGRAVPVLADLVDELVDVSCVGMHDREVLDLARVGQRLTQPGQRLLAGPLLRSLLDHPGADVDDGLDREHRADHRPGA